MEGNLPALADFGLSNNNKKYADVKEQREVWKRRTTKFLAPELWTLLTEPDKMVDEKKADIYSFGAMLFAIIFKNYPYKTKPTKNDRLYKFIAKKDKQGLWDILVKMRHDIQQ